MHKFWAWQSHQSKFNQKPGHFCLLALIQALKSVDRSQKILALTKQAVCIDFPAQMG